MVSFTKLFTLTAAALVATTADAFGVGSYFRPIGSMVSGVPGNTAPFRRSPCPGLNTLANHGHLPRDGRNITHQVLTDAIMGVYNIGADLAAVLVSQVPETFDLDLLSTHNFIEHDASLVHTDAHFGRPPTETNLLLVADLLQRANSEGLVGLEVVGKVRKDRLASCKEKNPECSFTPAQARTAFAEGAAFIGAMGAKRNDDSISVAHALSFLVLEMLPIDFKKADTPISLVDLGTYSAKIAAFAA